MSVTFSDSSKHSLIDHEITNGLHPERPALMTEENRLQARLGLTSAQADDLLNEWGYNELPIVEVPLWWVFVVQFTGTMPYMLELACVLALAVTDYEGCPLIS